MAAVKQSNWQDSTYTQESVCDASIPQRQDTAVPIPSILDRQIFLGLFPADFESPARLEMRESEATMSTLDQGYACCYFS